MNDDSADEKARIAGEIAALQERLKGLEIREAMTPKHPVQAPAAPEPAAAPPEDPSIAGNFFGSLAIFCFIFAAGLLVKLGYESGWLTPFRVIIAASFFGFAMIAAGDLLKERLGTYASLLPGGGIVILDIAIYSGGVHYDLYNDLTTLAAGAGVSLLSIYLLRKYNNPFYAFAATAGSYLIPFFVPYFRHAPEVAMGFFLIWDVVYSILATRLKSRGLLLTAAYLGIGSLYLTHLPGETDLTGSMRLILFQFAQVCVFAVATRRYSIIHQSTLTPDQAWSFFPILVLFYLLEFVLLSRVAPGLAGYGSLAFGFLLFALYRSAKSRLGEQTLASEPMIIACLAFVFVHGFYLELLPAAGRGWFGIFLLALYPWMRERKAVRQGDWALLSVAYGLLIGFSLFLSLGWYEAASLQSRSLDLPLLNFAFSLLLLLGFIFYAPKEKRDDPSSEWALLIYGCLLSGWVGVYHLDRFLRANGTDVALLLTFGFLVFGAFMLRVAYYFRLKLLVYAGLAGLLLAAGRFFFIDLGSESTVARLICVLVLGVILYLGGAILRNAQAWSVEAPKPFGKAENGILVVGFGIITLLHLLPQFRDPRPATEAAAAVAAPALAAPAQPSPASVPPSGVVTLELPSPAPREQHPFDCLENYCGKIHSELDSACMIHWANNASHLYVAHRGGMDVEVIGWWPSFSEAVRHAERFEKQGYCGAKGHPLPRCEVESEGGDTYRVKMIYTSKTTVSGEGFAPIGSAEAQALTMRSLGLCVFNKAQK